MSEPFLAEIRMFGFNFAPRGWAFCDGQILPINQNQSLYSLLGTTFGGDGRTTFGLPDLRGRTPIHRGNSNPLGERSGDEAHALTAAEMPQHDHGVRASSASATQQSPEGAVLANSGGDTYHTPTNLVGMSPAALTAVGGGQAHDNMQPFLTVNFAIAMQGLFPSRN